MRSKIKSWKKLVRDEKEDEKLFEVKGGEEKGGEEMKKEVGLKFVGLMVLEEERGGDDDDVKGIEVDV